MSVRSKTTGKTPRRASSVKSTHHPVHVAMVTPKLSESEAKKFLKWYWNGMKPHSPIPVDIRKILEKSSKARFHQDDEYILPGMALQKAHRKKLADKKKAAIPIGSRRFIRVRRVA